MKNYSINDSSWNLIYKKFKHDLNLIEFPIVIKSDPLDYIEYGYASHENYSFINSQLIPNPINNEMFLDEKDFLEYKQLYKNKRVQDVRLPKFIVDFSKSVEWNIKGYNSLQIEKHNMKIKKHLSKYGKLTNNIDELAEFKNSIIKLFKNLYQSLIENNKYNNNISNNSQIDLSDITINNRIDSLTLHDLMKDTLSTSIFSNSNNQLTKNDCLKAARSLKSKMNQKKRLTV